MGWTQKLSLRNPVYNWCINIQIGHAFWQEWDWLIKTTETGNTGHEKGPHEAMILYGEQSISCSWECD